MKYEVDLKVKAAIEEAINQRGATEVTVKVEGKKLTVLQVKKTKIL